MCGVCGVVCVSGWEMYMHAMYEEGSVEGLCVHSLCSRFFC